MPGASRRLTTILAADVAGYSRLTGADEEGTLARMRALRADLIGPIIARYHGRVFKITGDGILIEFASVVDAVRGALDVQRAMAAQNASIPADRRIEFRMGINVGDVVVEADGDLMGDGVNIAARLEGIADPGGICISGDAYRQVRDRLTEEFTDLGNKALKNIVRSVRVYSVGCDAAASAPALRAAAPEKFSPPRLSLVVLPFANLGGDPGQDYFVDGVTESLTTDLSRMSGMLVIGRNTAFTYKMKHADLKQIGRDLNVRYVLEGSMQRGGNRMRVNAQLIDAETGDHLWAERFDKPVADLFDMQDEIVARLAGQLGTQLTVAEARRAERAPHPDSMDLYFQGMACMHMGPRPEHMTQARNFFERALALDPRNVEALVGMGTVDWTVGSSFMTGDRAARFATAEASVTRALSLVPDHAWAHLIFGAVKIYTNRIVQGIAECERALVLDQNLAHAHGLIGNAKQMLGRSEETEGHVNEALRLSPRDSLAYTWMVFAGLAKLHLGADEEAVERFSRAVEMNPNFPFAHFALGAALANLGRLEEAQVAAKVGLALVPAFTISRYRAGVSSDNPVYLRKRERLIDGMRKAGVPE